MLSAHTVTGGGGVIESKIFKKATSKQGQNPIFTHTHTLSLPQNYVCVCALAAVSCPCLSRVLQDCTAYLMWIVRMCNTPPPPPNSLPSPLPLPEKGKNFVLTRELPCRQWTERFWSSDQLTSCAVTKYWLILSFTTVLLQPVWQLGGRSRNTLTHPAQSFGGGHLPPQRPDAALSHYTWKNWTPTWGFTNSHWISIQY